MNSSVFLYFSVENFRGIHQRQCWFHNPHYHLSCDKSNNSTNKTEMEFWIRPWISVFASPVGILELNCATVTRSFQLQRFRRHLLNAQDSITPASWSVRSYSVWIWLWSHRRGSPAQIVHSAFKVSIESRHHDNYRLIENRQRWLFLHRTLQASSVYVFPPSRVPRMQLHQRVCLRKDLRNSLRWNRV
jgi:hypothetical protein